MGSHGGAARASCVCRRSGLSLWLGAGAGEIHELREELSNPKMEKKKDAVKKVIAAMTVGKDVSMLFTDVVNCIQTVNIELKKLVYLYLINYAKSQPDLAILAVNTFVKVRRPAPSARAARSRAHASRLLWRYPSPPSPRCAAGHARPQPADPRAGGADDGVHPRGQDRRVPLRAAAQVS